VARRSYHQFCATAKTLDLIGERWTLLIVRELLSGPKRFSDLHRALPGLGTALLSSRLHHLEAEGLVKASRLPAPARSAAYELTEAGWELRPVVMAIARWGLRWALDSPESQDAFEPGWAVLGMQAIFDSDRARGVDAVYEFRIGDEVLHARIEDGAIDSRYGPADRPDAIVVATPEAFAELASGRLRLSDAIVSGGVEATGDKRALAKLRQVFRWPERRDRHALPAPDR
jgi:DNA-binding HxlR family transcriptional regulator/putative sterol carrier protein